MNLTLFLMVLMHGAVGAWDEIIPITLAVLTTVLGAVVFLVGRRFEPEVEETAVDEDVTS